MIKEKQFDAVKMMREIRRKLHQKYQQNPEDRIARLKAIREKYGIKEPKKV